MLVLSRRLNESIKLGEEITLTVIGIQGNRVRLGIEAPACVNIMRAELELELPATERQASGQP